VPDVAGHTAQGDAQGAAFQSGRLDEFIEGGVAIQDGVGSALEKEAVLAKAVHDTAGARGAFEDGDVEAGAVGEGGQGKATDAAAEDGEIEAGGRGHAGGEAGDGVWAGVGRTVGIL
jgi:hypothetical protein